MKPEILYLYNVHKQFVIFSHFVIEMCKFSEWTAMLTGAPRLARPPKPGPCLDFGFQYALIRNNCSQKKLGQNIGPCLAQIRGGAPG